MSTELGGGATLLARLSWPNVVGKRCLAVGAHLGEIRDALAARGAASIDEIDDARQLLPVAPFDLVVGWGVLSGSESPLASMRAVHDVTRGVVVSIEPVDLVLTFVARPWPLLRFAAADAARPFSMNGRAHHRLLTAAGFTVERPSPVIPVVNGDGTRLGLVPALLARALGRGGPGIPHRALVARAQP